MTLRRGTASVGLVLTVALASACSDDPASDVAPVDVSSAPMSSEVVPTVALSSSDESEILAVVASAQLVASGADRLGSPLRLSVVRGEAGWTMSPQTEEHVEIAVAPASVTWVDGLDDVLGDDALAGTDIPEYTDVGAVLILGVPRSMGDGSVEVISQFWCGTACGGGALYHLERDATGWRTASVTDVWEA